ncbi:MAG: phosphoglycerate dehydrogenase [Acidobacteria bacterium]|nr:phosphoglycerate dehydrogenase [Acidobacteriota bacterium]MCA1637102.1 phosphoglycerate dehydrogenase [Acidobacteriota bacterium]
MSNIKVFVADDVNEEKLAPLRDAGFMVEKRIKLSTEELAGAMKDFDGLIVRSETKVRADLMDKLPKLRVIGRAGVGVDNIDVKAATKRGIVVMNAPDGNTITTAEHTIALLVSMARNVPQAHAKLQSGVWDKKSFVGVELNGKTLGVIGLGRIGKHVAKIAKGFGMRILAFDPFVSGEMTKDLGMEIGTLDEVFSGADFITIHTPVTDETRGIVGKDAFTKMKRGVRLVNCARGGLIDETALLEAIEDGMVAGAALDVYSTEPLSPDSPLLKNDKIITTPHLGASTTEAQEGVALTVAEQMRDYLFTGALRGAVNAPSMAAKELEAFQPFIDLAEKLGRFQAQIMNQNAIAEVKLEYAGELAEKDAAPITRAFLAGLLRDVSARVNVVNALHIAEERGINITTSYTQTRKGTNFDIRSSVATAEAEQTASGLVFSNGEGRITEIGNFSIEAIPTGFMLITKNKDVPGVIGKIGTLLGEAQVNISRFYLGREAKGGEALAVIEIDSPLKDEVLENLRNIEPVNVVRQVKL